MSIKDRVTSHPYWPVAKRYKNAIIFLFGFLVDAVTIDRIDAKSDLLIQIVYLLGLTFLLIYQYRFHTETWTPKPWLKRLWSYNPEALHFLYGGLLSAYVILYFKSTSGLRAFFFLFLLTILLVINEMPQVRRIGYRLRLGLYAFCVTSFLIYFIPILVARMNVWVFLLSLLISAGVVWWVAGRLATKELNPKMARLRLYLPAAGLLSTVLVLYFLRLIPPVPLSIQYQGIFHKAAKTQHGDYLLRYLKPPFYAFWRNDSQPYYYRDGDAVYYFARIFAPTRFKHEVMIRWAYYDETQEEFITTDYHPFNIKGGRTEGFRGYVSKEKVQPGKWKVNAETKDKRIIGYVTFDIKKDESGKDRRWKDLRM